MNQFNMKYTKVNLRSDDASVPLLVDVMPIILSTYSPSELETLARDRTDWRSACESAVEEFEVRRIQESESKWDLRIWSTVHQQLLSARFATGCVVDT